MIEDRTAARTAVDVDGGSTVVVAPESLVPIEDDRVTVVVATEIDVVTWL